VGTNLVASMAHINIFGDSIAYGVFDPAGGWVQHLRSLVEERNINEEDYWGIVFNLGISGNTSEDIVSRFHSDLEARQGSDPSQEQLFIFAVGVNDSQFLLREKKNKCLLETFEKNLQTLAYAAREFSDKIAFTGLLPVHEKLVNPIPWSPDNAYQNKHILKYNQSIFDFCQREKLDFLDLWPLWKEDNAGEYLHDGVHPNGRGHELIAKTMKIFLQKHRLL